MTKTVDDGGMPSGLSARNQRLWDLFDEAADLPPDQQQALLRSACADDMTLRTELDRLLADDRRLQQNEADEFLRSPLLRTSSPGRGDPSAGATETALEPTPAMIGRYEIVRVLGEGGMGVVYEAMQESPRRTVAVKVIQPGLLSPSVLRRFAREAQILGLLHHPGIASVYEASVTENGEPFFAMELVRGIPMDDYARNRDLDPEGCLGLMARVCDAVQHAHDHGVVHRDLKPSNILVDERGQPRVLDFGVARWLDDDSRSTASRTQRGHLVGTPLYMSPEQAMADPNLDRRSDVYTLGVLLFELLAGRLPYPIEDLSPPKAFLVIQVREPTRLGTLDRRFRGDIETIVGKALEKEPGRRYPSAADFAADIRSVLRHEPIKARPPTALYRLARLTRRHKTLVGTSAVLLGMLLVAGAIAAWQAVRLAHAERDRVLQRARRSQEVQDSLARAAVLREQARSSSGDLGPWTEVRAMAHRAEALAESGPVEGDLADRVTRLLAELDDEEKDRHLIARLEGIPLLQSDVDEKLDLFAEERALPEYREAFAEYGLRPAATGPAEAADLIQRRPSAARAAAIESLNHWLELAREKKAEEVPWLENVLSAADPVEWRQRLREAQARKDLEALRGLARDGDIALQRPQTVLLLYRALRASGEREESLRLIRRARDIYSGDFWINQRLGMALQTSQPPRLEEAIRFLTAAVAVRPDSPGARLNLGVALADLSRFDEAIAEYRESIKLKPSYTQAHYNLGLALDASNRPDEAIAAYKQVATLVPNSSTTHMTLGLAYLKQGRLAEAESSLRRSLEIDPNSAIVNTNLGTILQSQGDLPGAVPCFQRAVVLAPDVAMPRYNLGNALRALGDLPGAAASYREVLRIEPEHAEAHCNLGLVLLRQGMPGLALEFLKRGDELGTRLKGWSYPSAQWVEQCERFRELEDRLPAVLKGEDRSADPSESLELAELCRYKGLLVSSARLFHEAFTADEELDDDLRAAYLNPAAQAAAQAASGEGTEAAGLDEAARIRLRHHALEWLRADLSGVTSRLKGATPQESARLLGTIRGWQAQPSLAGVRDARKLSALSPDERTAWERLWADVGAALR